MNELVKKNLYLTHMDSDELYHYGVLGMHWGIRRYQPYSEGYQGKTTGKTVGEASKRTHYRRGDLMDTRTKGDSAATRRVKEDYNTMSDQEFLQKYYVSKDRYRKRVNKYGDPSKSTMAKIGRRLDEQNTSEKITRASKKILVGAGIAAGVTALSVGAVLGAKNIKKVNAAKKYMTNTDWSSTTMSMISDAKSPIRIRRGDNRTSATREALRNAPSIRSSGAPQLYTTRRNRYRFVR